MPHHRARKEFHSVYWKNVQPRHLVSYPVCFEDPKYSEIPDQRVRRSSHTRLSHYIETRLMKSEEEKDVISGIISILWTAFQFAFLVFVVASVCMVVIFAHVEHGPLFEPSEGQDFSTTQSEESTVNMQMHSHGQANLYVLLNAVGEIVC